MKMIYIANKNSWRSICTVFQVANLNPKDLSYTLKDYVFKDLQRDWPGYSETDRRTLESVLSRSDPPPFVFTNGTDK